MERVVYYSTANGVEPFTKWLHKLDRPVQARLLRRINRIERLGDFGGHKPLKGIAGVSELRDFSGPGYRIYYGVDGDYIVVILAGGDKSDYRSMARKAGEYWRDYLTRKRSGEHA